MTGVYRVRIKKSAEKEVRDLPTSALKRVAAAIQALAREPRPNGSQKLVGADAHRIRVGTYRILYSIDDEELVVEILAVRHRKEIYRSK